MEENSNLDILSQLFGNSIKNGKFLLHQIFTDMLRLVNQITNYSLQLDLHTHTRTHTHTHAHKHTHTHTHACTHTYACMHTHTHRFI